MMFGECVNKRNLFRVATPRIQSMSNRVQLCQATCV